MGVRGARIASRLPRRGGGERGRQGDGERAGEDAAVEEDVDGAAGRGTVRPGAEARTEHAGGERGQARLAATAVRRREGSKGLAAPGLGRSVSPVLQATVGIEHAHFPITMRCPKARSTVSQNVRKLMYSAGVIRIFLSASRLRTTTLPAGCSIVIESLPKGESSS